jgi:murein L,D-transpeptidase YafK
MIVTVSKSDRLLLLTQNGEPLFRARVTLGREPIGAKQIAGDGRTPEGRYHICLVKEFGKYGRSLGLDYPNGADGQRGFSDGIIDNATLLAIQAAQAQGRRPPWGTALGGEIYLHEGATDSDWTEGCIALTSTDMERLFILRSQIEFVDILP